MPWPESPERLSPPPGSLGDVIATFVRVYSVTPAGLIAPRTAGPGLSTCHTPQSTRFGLMIESLPSSVYPGHLRAFASQRTFFCVGGNRQICVRFRTFSRPIRSFLTPRAVFVRQSRSLCVWFSTPCVACQACPWVNSA